MKISEFTVPELDRFRKMCNFTNAERTAFDLKAKDYSNVQLAMEMNISESTVSVIMRRVRAKITTIMAWRD